MPGPPVSEAELHGYVDGDMDRGRREAVQAFLAASPGDAARVETWRRQNEAIRAAFAPVETGPLPWSFPLAPGAEGVAATKYAAGETNRNKRLSCVARALVRPVDWAFLRERRAAGGQRGLSCRSRERAGGRAAFLGGPHAGWDERYLRQAGNVGAPGI